LRVREEKKVEELREREREREREKLMIIIDQRKLQ
jgi:hypothetical protein